MSDSEIDVINVSIVEPDPTRRERLIACLPREAGFAVVSAEDDFLEACAAPISRHISVDVLVVNIDRPEMGRVDMWAAIHFLLPHTRIIALTQGNDARVLELALSAGVLALHPLEVDAETLRRAVRNVAEAEVDFDPELKKRATSKLLQPLKKTHIVPSQEQIQLLTTREREVLVLLGQGFYNREIADLLHVSEKTVRNCVSEILSKLELSNRTQAALWAKEHGFGE